jgi:capsule polysaccharide export protein KpsE/RkpR
MTFGERMKDILNQGVSVSKDIAAKAGEKAQDFGEKGFHASRDFLNKAGAKAQDFGEKSVLLVEIKQLEGRGQKLIAQLGAETYNALAEQGAPSVTPDTPAVKALLAELATIREAIDKREMELQLKQR